MLLGAIIIVKTKSDSAEIGLVPSRSLSLVDGTLACVEVLGRTFIEHKIERFLAADVKHVTVIAESGSARLLSSSSGLNVKVQSAQDVWSAAEQVLQEYAANGIQQAFITEVASYTECDLIDLFWFHRGSRQPITRAFDAEGVLDLWIVDCAKVQDNSLRSMLARNTGEGCSSYFVSRYVNRLRSFRDIRCFAEDVLRGKCELRPCGKEMRPGVWVDEGAQIHRRARIVAPVYIGRGTKVAEDTVITRFSNVESGCYIDYGTVIEQSSILPNSYIGIWLDIAHSVVNGKKLLHLDRDVLLEISDPSVIRENAKSSSRREVSAEPVPALLARSAESGSGSI